MSANKIYPCFWYNNQVKEAAETYIKALGEGKITLETPQLATFEMLGQRFMGINGGDLYAMNPSISMFVRFDDEAALKTAWNTLIEGGSALMELSQYPWAKKYGWLQDAYGLTWQLMLVDEMPEQRISSLFMFTKDNAGRATDAAEFYTTIFPDSKLGEMVHYEDGEGDKPEFVKHGLFYLANQEFMVMDSSGPHEFSFNEGVSHIIDCQGQDEVDFYWDKLTADGGEESMCGWLKDKFGVSWQVVPRELVYFLSEAKPEEAQYAINAMYKMKKIIIKDLSPQP